MPPATSRKRASPPPASSPPAKRQKAQTKAKPSVFDTVDAHKSRARSVKDTQQYLDALQDSEESSSDDDEDDHMFEDVPGLRNGTNGDEDDDDDDEHAWEDAIPGGASGDAGESDNIGDVSISVNEDGLYATAMDKAASTVRKGPSKRERDVRNGTHCIHVQALMWHNTVRNSWLNDKELHRILIAGLSEGIKIEIQRWRRDMRLPELEALAVKKAKKSTTGKKSSKGKANDKRSAREWEANADELETDSINMSRGDPTLRLLKFLTAYWRKRFTITAPGGRKQGYMPLKRLTQEINAWRKDRSDASRHGERIENLDAFRNLAKSCKGSRDVASQLFTALMRALGLEARMVANLQPAGIGWGKIEEARPLKDLKADAEAAYKDDSDVQAVKPASKPVPKQNGRRAPGHIKMGNPAKKPTRESTSTVINLDTDSDGSLSSPPSDLDDDDMSVIDVTPASNVNPRKKYDRDLHYPHYWTEVLSPISNTWIPVDPIVLSTVATNAELLATFEPRGKRADQAKQVMCYTIAHASDGTAKDVTVRYLKKHQLPGRTKGFRLPVEKVKVYDRRGKVRRYEEHDWFQTVMTIFLRPAAARTPADDLEEQTALQPLTPASSKPKAEAESLQWYKQSATLVLERHLRREEALLPSAVPVRTFSPPKSAAPEPVFRRADVVECKTAESWHKVGRAIVAAAQPLKRVPVRAVTTARRREAEDVLRATGERAMQGLFSRAQTEWIVPEAIGADGEVPRNAYGNMDVFVPSMVPDGAVHLRLKGAARVCRDLGVSHAEAVTGFEFGKRIAVPVIDGVVVARGNEEAVVKLWREREVEKVRKEKAKRAEQCLAAWRKFCTGLVIMERMRREYNITGKEEDRNPFVRKGNDLSPPVEGGGFLPDDIKPEEDEEQSIDLDSDDDTHSAAAGFVLDDGQDAAGGFLPAADISDASLPMPGTYNDNHGPAASRAPVSLRAGHASLAAQYGFDDRGRGSPGETGKPAADPGVGAGAADPGAGAGAPLSSGRRKRAPASAAGERTTDPVAGGPPGVAVKRARGARDGTGRGGGEAVAGTGSRGKTAAEATGSRGKTAAAGRGARALAGAKSTGRRSRFFPRAEEGGDEMDVDGEEGDGDGEREQVGQDDGLDDGEEDDEEEEDDDEEEEEEVLAPRRTTARTRAKP